MININITKEVIDFFLKEKITIDKIGSALMIIKALYDENYEFLDDVDKKNKNFNMLLMYAFLERKGFIYYTNDSEDVLYKLTEKSNKIIDLLPIEKTEIKNIDFNLDDVKNETNEISSWIEEWINLFPEGKINGRYLRDNKVQCSDRMKWFIKTYNYDKNTIIKATKSYIEHQENSSGGHNYTRNSSYFIYKGRSNAERISDLATWCERVKNNNKKENIIEYNRDIS